MATAFRNRYFITRNKTEFMTLVPETRDADLPGSRYYVRAFRYIEQNSSIAGKTFVVVEYGSEELPAYGDDVIVLVVSDFFQKMPVFLGRVGLVFKALGTIPKVNIRPSFSYLYLLMVLRYARSMAYHVPSRLAARKQAAGPMAPMLPLPAGDRDIKDLEPIPINRRTHDVSFLGSVATNARRKLSVTGVLGTPKMHSRGRMFAALRRYKEARPNRTVTLASSSFAASKGDSPFDFSELLRDTKVCVVPRGDVPETYRFFQGLRFGCVMIAEELPSEWFFDGAPTHIVHSWDELPAILDRVLSDEQALERESAKSLEWWNDVVSPEALGRYMMKQIEQRDASRTAAAAS